MFLHRLVAALGAVTVLLATQAAGDVSGSRKSIRRQDFEAEPPLVVDDVVEPPLVVTPGPGMPSLESLGITLADLSDDAWLQANTPVTFKAIVSDRAEANDSLHNDVAVKQTSPGSTRLHRRWGCENYGPFYKPSARACQAYLEALGTWPCNVGPCPSYTVMCQAGSGSQYAQVIGCGCATFPSCSASSYCMHVAHAVGVAINNCPVNGQPDWSRYGYETAWGNGNFWVDTWGPNCIPNTCF
ncbi:hypothetical protein OQA88_4653 [Cercophora sp. LCS_1]